MFNQLIVSNIQGGLTYEKDNEKVLGFCVGNDFAGSDSFCRKDEFWDCTGCGLCAQLCPVHAMEVKTNA